LTVSYVALVKIQLTPIEDEKVFSGGNRARQGAKAFQDNCFYPAQRIMKKHTTL
jgi:hypothetical protein